MDSLLSLSQLGWRPFYSQQLTLEDLQAASPARVMGVHRGGVSVMSEAGTARLVLPRSLAAAPTVGDWVLIEPAADRVLRVLERLSLIERIAAGEAPERQAIAANIDTLFIVTSCNDEFKQSRLERYLVLAREARVEPVVLLTKVDLCNDVERFATAVQQVAARVATLTLDARSATASAALGRWLEAGQTVAFVGSSGVGKSTLVNALLGADEQSTSGVREHDAKGRHTTTSRQMFALPGGAWVIDTPGMRELRLPAVEAGVSAVFEDIQEFALACRFRDCSHDGDGGCAVAAAVAAGRLDARRLANYLKLRREAANAARTVRERRERERHFGRVHRSAQRLQRQKKGSEW
jgi:ribosome biogenesis GTPase / thiamine phosphate phosphatase